MNSQLLNSRNYLLIALCAFTLLSLPLSHGPRPLTAEACWSVQLIECSEGTREQWPWCLPVGQGRCWRHFPNPGNPAAWGVNDRYYSVHLSSLCGEDDDQSLWIMGEPGTWDADFDVYPTNFSTYMTYGPIVTTNAEYAQVQFSMFFNNSLDFQDTICWGADSVFNLATTHIWVDTTFYTETDEGWRTFTMDLADLHRNVPTRDSVSALGRPQVFLYWWFKSDGDANRDVGAFIDDIVVATDDGSIDLSVGQTTVREPDSITLPTRIETGESILAQMSWATCDGGVPFYPDFHARLTLDGEIVLDSLVHGALPGSTVGWFTSPIEMTTAGEHTFQFQIDPLFEVAELNEGNNVSTTTFTVYDANVPPTFVWVTPSTDTLRTVDGRVMLSWLLSDPDDDATVTIHIDQDTIGCTGPIVPGTINRGETEIPDTATWSTGNIAVGQVRWLFAEYGDLLFLGCSYSPFPVLVMPLAGGGHEFVPVTFSLNQNYPNPFNPETQIQFSITQAGRTTLKVFDITGREVATLIDNDLTPGLYESNFNAGLNRPSGVYLYRLDAPEGSITKKMILLK